MFLFRGPLNIQRAESGEKIIRQTKQKSARVVDPTRRIFVKYDGKDSVDSPCDEFLEVPFIYLDACPVHNTDSVPNALILHISRINANRIYDV